MKFIVFLLCLFCTAYAEMALLPKSHILMTDKGIFLDMDDIFLQAQSVHYMGNGLYQVNYAGEYYGQCGRCGWALNENGKCTNQNCNQYGPRERD